MAAHLSQTDHALRKHVIHVNLRHQDITLFAAIITALWPDNYVTVIARTIMPKFDASENYKKHRSTIHVILVGICVVIILLGAWIYFG